MSQFDRYFLAGLVAGLLAGLLLAWALPLGPVALDPPGLKPEIREQWAVLAAMTYATDGDLDLASRRIAVLGGEPRDIIAPLAEQYINQLKPESQRRSLAKLALALGADSVNLRVYGATPVVTTTSRPVASPFPALSPSPTIGTAITPRPTPSVTPSRTIYRLFEQTRVACDQDKNAPRGRILVYVQDSGGKGLAGTRLRVQWADGQDVFFTGLKGTDPGYADFDMQPGRSYSVQVADGISPAASGLDTDQLQPDCPNDGKPHFRAWRLVFRRVD
ncbi:MAG: hypothetical protein HZB53_15860 [Chloroflexi bacterium]|nr:hypothetical protein [Chloroflexota bacterium]